MAITLDEEISKLGKQATQESKTDLPKAIATLRELQALLAQSSTDHVAETWLRLPLYLQKNGQFAEAVAEFERLTQHPKLKNQRHMVYEKFSLACKREKKYLASLAYDLLSHACKQLWELEKIAISQDGINRCKELQQKMGQADRYARHIERYQKDIQDTQDYIKQKTQPEVWQAIIQNSKAKLNLFKTDHVMTLCLQFSNTPSEEAANRFREGLLLELGILSQP